MWTSERARAGSALGMVALLGLAGTADAQPSVSLVGGGLSFGTVLPGAASVVVTPWTVGSGGRGKTGSAGTERNAPVFQISGAPRAAVSVSFPALPTRIDNGSGAGSLTVSSWTAQYNTSNGPSGAVSFSPSATAVSFTLGPSGRGYVSLGATVAAGASQQKGAYALTGGAVIEVR